jgi:hypothetical protein
MSEWENGKGMGGGGSGITLSKGDGLLLVEVDSAFYVWFMPSLDQSNI